MAKPLRLYQDWKGKNKFLLNGRLIFGPDARSLIVTLMLILVPVVIFCTFVARKFLHQFQESSAGYVIMTVTIIFTIYVLLLLVLTATQDPGIVPRNSRPPDEILNYDSSASVEAGGKTLARTKEVIVNGLIVRVKYCETCMVFRPPRCSHCSVCDNCVERFDHHCPWVGQCIGKRNYRWFFLFVSSTALLCAFVFSMSALHMKFVVDEYGTVWRAMKESPASLVLMAYCFVSLWFVGGLTGFHLYLISKNQTTYENFRHRADNRINVYNRGCVNNCIEVLCTRIEASKNNFQGYVNEECAKPPRIHEAAAADNSEDRRRVKVEDDVDIGDDLLKISQRRNSEEEMSDVRSRGSDTTPHKSPELDFAALGLESSSRSTYHSSLGGRLNYLAS
nr:protein S-acyltransferase 8-like [Ipomoea batatas]